MPGPITGPVGHRDHPRGQMHRVASANPRLRRAPISPLGPDLARRLDALNNRADRILAAEAEDAGLVLFGTGSVAVSVAAASAPIESALSARS